MVVADSGGCPTEGYSKRDFGICTRTEATGPGRRGGGGISRERTTTSACRIQGSVIRDRQHSGEQKTLWREDARLICWDRDEVCPGGQIIPCGGTTGRICIQVRRRDMTWKEL